MNIFVLDADPASAARMHCDTHVVKMIVETAQLLSTAHRVLDGLAVRAPYPSKTGKLRVKTIYMLDNDARDAILYQPTHINHPCAVWVRENSANYQWAYGLLVSLCLEYNQRYGKTHKTSALVAGKLLGEFPKNIKRVAGPPDRFALAMPDEISDGIKQTNAPEAVFRYRMYYTFKNFYGMKRPMKWNRRGYEENGRHLFRDYTLNLKLQLQRHKTKHNLALLDVLPF